MVAFEIRCLKPDKINIISYTENIASKRNDGRPPEIRKLLRTSNKVEDAVGTSVVQEEKWVIVCDGTERQ